MIVTIAKVADFDQFLRTFSTKGAEKRKQHGCRGSHIFRDPDDPGRVWVFFDWEIADYEKFLSDPEIPAIARELALREPPVKADPARERREGRRNRLRPVGSVRQQTFGSPSPRRDPGEVTDEVIERWKQAAADADRDWAMSGARLRLRRLP
jgi:quinol monooxygenase YgiN